jgi:hypothetical protein
MWMWIMIGAGLMLGLSALVGLALGAVFATIGREIEEMFEAELWRTARASKPTHRWTPKRGIAQRAMPSATTLRQTRVRQSV